MTIKVTCTHAVARQIYENKNITSHFKVTVLP